MSFYAFILDCSSYHTSPVVGSSFPHCTLVVAKMLRGSDPSRYRWREEKNMLA